MPLEETRPPLPSRMPLSSALAPATIALVSQAESACSLHILLTVQTRAALAGQQTGLHSPARPLLSPGIPIGVNHSAARWQRPEWLLAVCYVPLPTDST